ncbi:hypothetical protein B0J17DRAFT_631521 [Rhizoctonia solani]|nr:hypothetical protein B0J17DRAFT_631521 [Rhizoctonia solani]
MFDFLQQIALDIAVTRYFTAATITLLLYDSLLTLGDEIELIWPAKLPLSPLIALQTTSSPLWLAHCVIDFVIVTMNAIRQAPHFRYEETFNICFADITDSWTGWLNGIIYHAIILLLLTWLWLSTPRSSQTPFMKIVVRDGFIYFFTIFAAMLFNLIVWKNERQSLAALPYWSVWALTTHALLRAFKLRKNGGSMPKSAFPRLT